MSTNKAGLEIKDGIAVLEFDNPPVDSLGLELRQAIVEGIERANADPEIEAIVIIGAGAGFSGDPTVTATIERYRQQKGITPRKVSNDEIVERCIYALINEGARVAADGNTFSAYKGSNA